MNKILTAILTAALLLNFSALTAQHVCGTSTQSQFDARERLFQNRIDAANQQAGTSRDVTIYAPIKFHIVSQSDGSSGISETQILSLLCQINNYYADQDMIFYINYPFSYIKNSVLYNDPGSTSALNTIAFNWVNNSINVFITNSAGDGVAGYYLGPFQGYPYEHIIIRKSSIDGITGPHELGHFFSLAHPFLGWGQAGDTGWDPNIHGNPVGTYAPFGPPWILNEKMNGSNCLQAADGICDTPPDYFFANSPVDNDNDCTWDGNAMDPNGTLVVTMENNIMNYFDNCSDYVFTPNQKTAVRNDFNSGPRAYIRHSYVPPTADITQAPVLVEPINNEVTPGFNLVYFDWEPSPNAQRYLLEVDQQPTFAFLPKRFIVANGSSVEIEDVFNPNVTYHWRVTPYNDGNTCNLPTSTTGVFKTGGSVSTKNIDIVNNWSVMPNPVRQNEFLNIRVEATEAFDGDIRLFTLAGQLLKNVSRQHFSAGENSFDFDISGVSSGMYIVAIQSEKGVINKKIVITQ